MQQTFHDERDELIGHVAKNPYGLKEVHDYTLSQEIAFRLLDSIGLKKTLIRLCFSEHVEELLEALFTRFCGIGRLEEFVDAIFEFPNQHWQEPNGDRKHGIPAEAVARIVLPKLDQERFLTDYAETLCRETHPLFPLIDPDRFWWLRVQRFVNESNLNSAWREINLAHAGLVVHGADIGSREEKPRCHRATLTCQRKLIRYLYDQMIREGLIERLDGDESFPNVGYTVHSVHPLPAPREGQQKRRIRILSPCFGHEMAINLDRGWSGADKLIKPKFGDHITAEAAMVLKIAEYFEM